MRYKKVFYTEIEILFMKNNCLDAEENSYLQLFMLRLINSNSINDLEDKTEDRIHY